MKMHDNKRKNDELVKLKFKPKQSPGSIVIISNCSKGLYINILLKVFTGEKRLEPLTFDFENRCSNLF